MWYKCRVNRVTQYLSRVLSRQILFLFSYDSVWGFYIVLAAAQSAVLGWLLCSIWVIFFGIASLAMENREIHHFPVPVKQWTIPKWYGQNWLAPKSQHDDGSFSALLARNSIFCFTATTARGNYLSRLPLFDMSNYNVGYCSWNVYMLLYWNYQYGSRYIMRLIKLVWTWLVCIPYTLWCWSEEQSYFAWFIMLHIPKYLNLIC